MLSSKDSRLALLLLGRELCRRVAGLDVLASILVAGLLAAILVAGLLVAAILVAGLVSAWRLLHRECCMLLDAVFLEWLPPPPPPPVVAALLLWS